MADEKQASLDDWQQYPIFAELLTDHGKYDDLKQKCLKSCEELDRIIKAGGPEQKEVAQKSLNAYGYALGLLDQAVEERDKFLAEQNG